MTAPLVSVVVPSFNRAEYLRSTIDSILAQDHPHIECVVVDACSTDGSVEILRSYGDRIRWVSEPDDGHADAINKGWRMSKGDILAWLNADDLYAPGAIARVAASFAADPRADMVYGDCGYLDAAGNVLPGRIHRPVWDLARAVETCDWTIPQPAAFLTRRILEQVGWLDTAFIQKKDHELWLRVGLIGRVRYEPALLAYARLAPGISQRGDEAAAACIQLTEKFLQLPDLPAHLRARSFRRRARSNAHLVAAINAWPRENGAHRALALRHVRQAIAADPLNVPRIAYRLVGMGLPSSVRLPRRRRPDEATARTFPPGKNNLN